MTMTNPTNPHLHQARKISAPSKPDVVVTGNKLGESEKAIKFEVLKVDTVVLDNPKTEWFPLSQINKTFVNPNKMDEDTLTISNWIATTKGYI